MKGGGESSNDISSALPFYCAHIRTSYNIYPPTRPHHSTFFFSLSSSSSFPSNSSRQQTSERNIFFKRDSKRVKPWKTSEGPLHSTAHNDIPPLGVWQQQQQQLVSLRLLYSQEFADAHHQRGVLVYCRTPGRPVTCFPPKFSFLFSSSVCAVFFFFLINPIN